MEQDYYNKKRNYQTEIQQQDDSKLNKLYKEKSSLELKFQKDHDIVTFGEGFSKKLKKLKTDIKRENAKLKEHLDIIDSLKSKVRLSHENNNNPDTLEILKEIEKNKDHVSVIQKRIDDITERVDVMNTLENRLIPLLRSIQKEESRIMSLYKLKEELQQQSFKNVDDDVIGLYPHVLDPNFNIKIAEKKEFYENAYKDDVKDAKVESDLQCNREFELAPHQMFVRNFMSSLTPYNSLFLYHGVGTGKTCSAITICEEVREYMKLMNKDTKVYVIASPNVQDNFKLQLFDERKLKIENDKWVMQTCTGTRLIDEVNPLNASKVPKERLIKQINRLISKHYSFMGYSKFSNMIEREYKKYEHLKDRNKIIKSAIKKKFSDSILVIDEVHNIRITDDSPNKDVAKYLINVIKNSVNLKLLFLSATPMFNDYKEILFLVNLLNMNDRRLPIKPSDIFDNDGNFKRDKNNTEIGKELFIAKTRGYFSYVRGENKLSFPYRIYPMDFIPKRSILNDTNLYPRFQVNNEPITTPIRYIDLYMSEMSKYQGSVYKALIGTYTSNLRENAINLDLSENTSKMDLRFFETPYKAINMVFPMMDKNIDEIMSMGEMTQVQLESCVGTSGLESCMEYNNKKMSDFQYNSSCLEQYGRIFHIDKLKKFSCKLHEIIKMISRSKGIVMIYSQFIDNGSVLIALALEELGFTRHSSNSLFKTPPVDEVDSTTMLSRDKHRQLSDKPFKSAKYAMITGNVNLSPNNEVEINASTNISNINGEDIKVIIISRAGSEGIDFKYVRQVHIFDAWYNMNRNEQIIGRSVRFCSHSKLPFEERNVEIYMHGTRDNSNDIENIDLYMYRLSEKKALQIGNISRVLKENATDCILNKALQETKLKYDNYTLKLSSGIDISYNLNDKAHSGICDYMNQCDYKCLPIDIEEKDKLGKDVSTYNIRHLYRSNDILIKKIKSIFATKYVVTKDELLKELNIDSNYSLEQINIALTILIEDSNEYLKDVLGRLGRLKNVEDLYMFQPMEIKEGRLSYYDRTKPIDFKHKTVRIEYIDNINDSDNKNTVNNKSSYKDFEIQIKPFEDEYFEIVKLSQEYNAKKKIDNKNWNQLFVKAVHDFVMNKSQHNKNKDYYHRFIVHRIVDKMSFREKKNLITYLSMKNKEKNSFNSFSEFDVHAYEYIQLTLHFKIDENTNGYYLVSKENSIFKVNPLIIDDSNTLIKPLQTEMEKIKNITTIREERFSKTANPIIGFVKVNDNGSFVFKTREGFTKSGSTCIQSNKQQLLKKYNTIKSVFPFSLEEGFPKKDVVSMLCCKFELMLRVMEYENKMKSGIVNENTFFTNPEESYIVKLI